MEYVYVVVDTGFEILGVFDTDREANEFIFNEQIQWPIFERPEYFVEQVRKY